MASIVFKQLYDLIIEDELKQIQFIPIIKCGTCYSTRKAGVNNNGSLSKICFICKNWSNKDQEKQKNRKIFKNIV